MINRDDLKIVRSRRNSAVDEEPHHDGTHHNLHRRLSLEEKITDVAESILVNTSCLAIGNIVIRKYALLKTLWCVAFVLCTILTIRQLYNLSTNYFSYPVTTYIELKYKKFEFPSVTICNLNPLRRSMLNTTAKPALYTFLNDLETKFKDVVDNGTEIETHSRDWKKFRLLLNNETTESIRKMGHQVDDLILQCIYNGKPCNLDRMFTPMISRTYGNCYTFNSWKNFNKSRSWFAKYGEDNDTSHDLELNQSVKGLIMTLFIEQDEYLTNFISAAGVRVHIHPPRSFEAPQVHGFSIPPGFEVSMGISLDELKRLGDPHGNCTDGTDFENKYKMKYTVKACREVCQQNNVERYCKCIDPVNREFYTENKPQKPCVSVKEFECMQKYSSLEDVTDESCVCLLPCTEKKYKIKQSMSEWPADSYERRLYGDLFDLHPKIKPLRAKSKSKFRRNLINLIIYIEDTFYNEIKEKPAYEWFNFLSDIGGSLSLFLGFSVLTGFEFIEAVGLFLAYLIGKLIYRHPSNSEKSNLVDKSKLQPPEYSK